jgi:hypothetical protein
MPGVASSINVVFSKVNSIMITSASSLEAYRQVDAVTFSVHLLTFLFPPPVFPLSGIFEKFYIHPFCRILNSHVASAAPTIYILVRQHIFLEELIQKPTSSDRSPPAGG